MLWPIAKELRDENVSTARAYIRDNFRIEGLPAALGEQENNFLRSSVRRASRECSDVIALGETQVRRLGREYDPTHSALDKGRPDRLGAAVSAETRQLPLGDRAVEVPGEHPGGPSSPASRIRGTPMTRSPHRN